MSPSAVCFLTCRRCALHDNRFGFQRNKVVCCWLVLPARRLFETRLNPGASWTQKAYCSNGLGCRGPTRTGGFTALDYTREPCPTLRLTRRPKPSTRCQHKGGGKVNSCVAVPSPQRRRALAHLFVVISCSFLPHAPHRR